VATFLNFPHDSFSFRQVNSSSTNTTSTLRSKLQAVRKIAKREMGFVPLDETTAHDKQNNGKPSAYNNYMYVVEHHIVGLLVTETITKAYPASGGDSSALLLSSQQAIKANLGIHLMWVHTNYRNHGIATKLLDVARERSVFGYTSIPPNRVAFSSPTEAGLVFAQSYMAKHEAPVLVYQFASESE
jgi:N-acetyltransferase